MTTETRAHAAAVAPDLSDHLRFLNGFRVSGNKFIGMRPINGMSLHRGEFNPSAYALRIRTGVLGSEFGAGSLRRPAPVWRYAAFGYLDAGLWSFFSGVFMGWGSTLPTPVQGDAGKALNLIFGCVFFQRTFAILADFCLPERVEIVSPAIALALGWAGIMHLRPDGDPTAVPESAGVGSRSGG